MIQKQSPDNSWFSSQLISFQAGAPSRSCEHKWWCFRKAEFLSELESHILLQSLPVHGTVRGEAKLWIRSTFFGFGGGKEIWWKMYWHTNLYLWKYTFSERAQKEKGVLKVVPVVRGNYMIYRSSHTWGRWHKDIYSHLPSRTGVLCE